MKKQFLCFLALMTAGGCSTYWEGAPVSDLSVSFMQSTDWDGKVISARQGCQALAGHGSTPPLYVTGIPRKTNLIIMEIDNLDVLGLDKNGGHGSIGFYHNGESSASLLPVPGESYELPSFAFKEKASRVNPARPYPYMPPCIEKKHRYSATIKAVHRTGSFDKQKTTVLGIGKIYLGKF